MAGTLRTIRTAVVDASEPLAALDLSVADEWRVVVTWKGRPLAYRTLASPGKHGPGLLELALGRHALQASEPPPSTGDARISVVVATHRRPGTLRDLLGSLAALDPAPHEIVVVDNDPGTEDARALVEDAGCRYVREDRPGLNRARRRGLLAATGDVVAFTDDDCLVPPTWLAQLPRLFADEAVGAVTGPVFPAELRNGVQLRREEEAGFPKMPEPRRFHAGNVAPVNSGAVGAGASMAFRRSLALELELFPPELDVGTPVPGGGDLYALFRVMKAGHEVAYEPGMYALHRHTAEPGSLRRLIRDYGIGVGGYYAKVLWEEREWRALSLWHWLWRRWIEAILDTATGEGDRGRVRVRLEYALWTLAGPRAWRRSLRALDAEGREVLERARAARSDPLPPPRRRARPKPVRRPGPPLQSSGDASGCTVVFGPGEEVAESLRPLGAEIVMASGSRDALGWWTAVAEAVAAASTDVVAVPLPGVRVGPEWLLDVKRALEGDRVAAAVGAGVPGTDAPAPAEYLSRHALAPPYPLRGAPAQYLAVRRDLYERVGGLRPELARLAAYAPVSDFVQRALDAGFTVARCHTRDLSPPGLLRPARARGEWARTRARGALMVVGARKRGGAAGAWWFVTRGLLPHTRLWRPSDPERDSVRHALGAMAAFWAGAGWALVPGELPRPREPDRLREMG